MEHGSLGRAACLLLPTAEAGLIAFLGPDVCEIWAKTETYTHT